MDNLDPATYGGLLAKLPLATTRFIAISKSGGTGETLMQTAAALSAVQAGRARGAHRRIVLRHQRGREGRQAQRLARSARRVGRDAGARSGHRRALFGPVQCRAAARRDPRARHCGDPRRRRDGAGAGAGEAPGGRRAVRARRRAQCRGGSRGQEHRRADGLRRQARTLLALVRAALGREPRQGRQGHDAARRARAGRPAFAAAALHRRSARQAVHRHHGRHQGAGPAHRRGAGEARGRARSRRAHHGRSRRRAGPRHRRDAGQERLPGAHDAHRDAERGRASAR